MYKSVMLAVICVLSLSSSVLAAQFTGPHIPTSVKFTDKEAVPAVVGVVGRAGSGGESRQLGALTPNCVNLPADSKKLRAGGFCEYARVLTSAAPPVADPGVKAVAAVPGSPRTCQENGIGLQGVGTYSVAC